MTDEIGRFLVVYVVASVGNGHNLAIRVESLDFVVVFGLDVVRSATSDEQSGTMEFADVRGVNPLRQRIVEQVNVESPLIVLRAVRIADKVLEKEAASDGIL